jgi:hypothetical protein
VTADEIYVLSGVFYVLVKMLAPLFSVSRAATSS